MSINASIFVQNMPLLPQIERTEIVSCAYLLNVPIHFIQTARAVGAAARRGDAAQKKTSGPSQTVGGGGVPTRRRAINLVSASTETHK